MENVLFYARMCIEILVYVLAVSFVVYTVEKAFGLNRTPRPGQSL